MPNTLAPFGFQFFGLVNGTPPNFAPSIKRIAQADNVPVGQGDVLTALATGYVSRAAAGTAQIAGVFVGCRYLSVAFQRTVWRNYWPGSDANGDVEAMVIDHPDALFKVQASAAAFVIADIGINAQFTNPAPNAANGLSAMVLDSATKAVTATHAFKVWELWSKYAAPGENGTDDASNNNIALVKLNYSLLGTQLAI
jgi:hypothetical protein